MNVICQELEWGDIDAIAQYWLRADVSFLKGMGADKSKIPTYEPLSQMLSQQLNTSKEQTRTYYLIWQLNGIAIGHSNTNPTSFGEEAKMHLHLWHTAERRKG